jgi:N-acetyl-gamma-glutamyl-phosphate reductase
VRCWLLVSKVIDLAADFRLKDPAVFQQWYAMEHSCTDLLAEAVYGLPEVNRDAIAQHVWLAWPVAIHFGTTGPAAAAGRRKQLIDTQTLIADCKSGVSGAGRKAEVVLAEAGDNFRPMP